MRDGVITSSESDEVGQIAEKHQSSKTGSVISWAAKVTNPGKKIKTDTVTAGPVAPSKANITSIPRLESEDDIANLFSALKRAGLTLLSLLYHDNSGHICNTLT